MTRNKLEGSFPQRPTFAAGLVGARGHHQTARHGPRFGVRIEQRAVDNMNTSEVIQMIALHE